MEEDVHMENGFDSDYPDPYANNPIPYPTLSQGTDITSPPANGTAQASNLVPPRNIAPKYTTLADYFSIGNIKNDRLLISTEPAQDAPSDVDNDEDAIAELVGRQPNAATGAGHESAHESDASGSSNNQTPWTSNFFARYGSGSPQPEDTALPGFHALPEVDTFYTPPRSCQHSSFPGSVQTSRYGPASSEPSAPQPRGRGRGRSRGSGRGSGRGSRGGYKKLLKGTEHADLFKKPPMPRDPTIGRRGRRKAREQKGRQQADPGEEYKEAAAAANQAFFAEDYDTALEHIFRAIQANPEVYHGHLLMSEILEKQGRVREALYAVTNGAVAKRDPDIWAQVAERYLALDDPEHHREDLVSACTCYTQAVKLDLNNCELREGKLKMLLELEEWAAARLECKNLIRIRPAELDYVRQYASLCDMTGKREDRERAHEAYKTAFQLLQEQASPDKPVEQWDHLNVYLDLLVRNHHAEYGTFQAKRISRWFLGRKDDIFWDAWKDDDREFDVDDSRRAHVPSWRQGVVSRNPSHYGAGVPLDIRVKMGIFRAHRGLLHQPEALRHLSHLRDLSDEVENYSDMFFDVAECLKNSGFPETAITFYEPLKSRPELLDEAFWDGIGQSYMRVGRTEDAEESLLNVVENSPSRNDIRVALIKIYTSTDQKVKAHAMINEVLRFGGEELLRQEKIRIPKQKAAGSSKGTGKASHPSKKKRILAPKAGSGPRSVRQRDVDGNENLSDSALRAELNGLELDDDYDSAVPGAEEDEFDLHAGSNQTQRLRRRKVKVQEHYQRLQELWQSFESRTNADTTKQWIQHASALAKAFREVKEFFPSYATHTHDKYFTHVKNGIKMQGSKQMKDMLALKHQLEKSVSNEEDALAMQSIEGGASAKWEDITFSEWHRILSTLAIAYAESVAQGKCYDIIQNVLMRANVFRHDLELNNTTLSVIICCALMFNDSKLMIETARQWEFPGIHSSTTTARLVAAAGSLSHGEAALYHRNTQSWAQIAVKEQDFLAMTPEMRDRADWGDDGHRLWERAERINSSGQSELDAGLLTTYAHILGTKHGGSTKAENPGLALSYLFRALALQPDNVVVNLSLALTYLSISMRDGAENKQYTMAQGQAFLYRYYDLRTTSKTASNLQEAEYNMGRAWQLIGLTYLAVPAYEKVFDLSAQVQQEAKGEIRAEEQIEDFAQEAALALRSVYIAAGNLDAARAVTEKWLVL